MNTPVIGKGRIVAGFVLVLAGLLAVGASPSVSSSRPAATDSFRRTYDEGLQQFREKDTQSALKAFEIVSSKATGYLRLCATNMVGQINRLAGDPEAALKAFASVGEQAIAVASKDTNKVVVQRAEVLAQLSAIYRVELLEEQERWDDAVAECERIRLKEETAQNRDQHQLTYNPSFYEKLARMYWKVGNKVRASNTFKELLKKWPAYDRASIVLLALRACGKEQGNALVQRKFESLCSPVDEVSMPRIDENANSLASKAASGYREMVLKRMEEVAARDDAGLPWQQLLYLHRGTMLYGIKQFDLANQEFLTAAWLLGGKDVPPNPVGRYAKLWLALLSYQEGRLNDSAKDAWAIADATPIGCHLHRIAQNIGDMSKKSLEAAATNVASKPSK